MSEDILGYHTSVALLASSGQRPGMLLNILQCTGRPPPHPAPVKNYLVQSVNSAKGEKAGR